MRAKARATVLHPLIDILCFFLNIERRTPNIECRRKNQSTVIPNPFFILQYFIIHHSVFDIRYSKSS